MSERWPEPWNTTHTLISARRHVSPKRLEAPGPDAEQLQALFELAATAPDHGELTPWRFIVVPADKRHLMGEVFGQALLDRDASATPQEVQDARDKAQRAPLVMLAVALLGEHAPEIPPAERLVSLGCAIQNILLGAHALGYGTGLTSGRAMGSPRLAELFALGAGETPVCCINIGTVARAPKARRARPLPERFSRTL